MYLNYSLYNDYNSVRLHQMASNLLAQIMVGVQLHCGCCKNDPGRKTDNKEVSLF